MVGTLHRYAVIQFHGVGVFNYIMNPTPQYYISTLDSVVPSGFMFDLFINRGPVLV